jgi:hypothetical protein
VSGGVWLCGCGDKGEVVEEGVVGGDKVGGGQGQGVGGRVLVWGEGGREVEVGEGKVRWGW